MRLIDADAFKEKYGDYYAEEEPAEGFIGTVGQLIDNAPTVEERPKGASNYSEGWMDGYNHAIDQIFKELNYLLKNHVIEELRKRIKR